MVQKKHAKQLSNCQITEASVVITDSKVTSQKQKDEAKKTLYINRI